MKSIEVMSESCAIWNRSHSELTWGAMVLDEESETRNLRQVSAEMKRKRDALVEVNFKYRKSLVQSEIHARNANNLGDSLEADLENICHQEEAAKAQMLHEAILGASKDIEALRSSYDKIKSRILDKHGKLDEEVFELEEKSYWIKRGFKQSMQDVRERGHITKGEQMLLEQIGLEPNEVFKDIRSYLEFIGQELEKGSTIDQEARQDFFSQMEQKYLSKVEKKLSVMGDSKKHLFITGTSDDSRV